jgi:DNA-binding NarL/FixJ family response regulator
VSLDVVPISPDTLRVVVFEAHAVVREAFASLIGAATGLSALGVATVDELERHARAGPGIAHASADRELDIPWVRIRGWSREDGPRVVILSASGDPRFVGRVFLEGIHGFIHKRCPPPPFLDAIRRVGAGESVAVGIGAFSPAAPDVELSGEVVLTGREIQVLQLLAADLTAR